MNRMQKLIAALEQAGYPVVAVAKDSGVRYGRLHRCKTTGQDLKHEDARKLIAYAESVKIRVSDEVES